MAGQAAEDPRPLDDWRPAAALEDDEYESLPDFQDVVGTARDAGIDLAMLPLPFYSDGVWLLRIIPSGGSEAAAGYGLWSGRGLLPLDGTSTPIHDANEQLGLALRDSNVLAYVTWFCRFVHGDDGPFWAVLRHEDLNVRHGGQGPVASGIVPDGMIVKPVVERGEGDSGWVVTLAVQYGDALFRARFEVEPDGAIEMIDDEPLTSGLPVDSARNGRPLPWSVGPAGIEIAGHAPAAPRHPNQRSVQRSVGEALVRLQLLRALRRGDCATLFQSQATDDDQLLVEFAEFVLRAAAFVVLESRMDYVERLVATVMAGLLKNPLPVKFAVFSPNPEPSLAIPQFEDGDVLLVSLHEGRRVERCEAVAFVLGSTDAAALVGCRSRSDVPAPLAQIADLTLDLGNVDAATFRALFCEVFACDWPDGADIEGRDWLGYLEPVDLQRALRDRAFRAAADASGARDWQPQDALAAIEARARERLARFLPEESRRLADVAGLGEARQIVEDLMADLREALAGRLPWSDIDRGMLLAGPPGTGKTMLARIVARECGVRFVNGRIGDWMTGDSGLGSVIQAMRQTFSDARSYAPCVLFLDEIDSLGNRQNFGGRNEAWDVALLTAVLAEIQGFDTTPGIFLIGATNHEGEVDPALRRAGRLDQTVRLDYPIAADLTRILEQYLAPYRATGRVDSTVDVAALGAVMAGASGAQVAQYVRDAARRARRDSLPIGMRHLLAAATGTPRRASPSLANSPAELERTAFHEAGHAVMQLLGQESTAALTIVSIVERADGALGYTGFAPGDTTGWTAAHYQAHLEVLLAGRAAEQLRYGEDRVSSGAGGPSPGCDLSGATALAAYMLCQANLGVDDGLAWRAQPTTPDDLRLLRVLLDASYARAVAGLREHWRAVEAVAQALVRERQLLGREVIELARDHGVGPRAATVPAGGAAS